MDERTSQVRVALVATPLHMALGNKWYVPMLIADEGRHARKDPGTSPMAIGLDIRGQFSR